MLTIWNSDIIPATVLCNCKKGETMCVTFELGCKPSAGLAKYHELTVLKVIGPWGFCLEGRVIRR